MKKNNKLKDDIQVLSRIEKKVFDKACRNLMGQGWDPMIECDQDWGWIILATKTFSGYGVILRRIKPFALNSISDFERALKIQMRLRPQLVEVLPYRVFLGNKISLGELLIPFKFFLKPDFQFWTKFFKSKNFSLKTNSIDKAMDLEVG